MTDLAPAGHLSLLDFYDRFVDWQWNAHRPVDELDLESRIVGLPSERAALHRAALAEVIDGSLAEAVRLFALGRLRACVVFPETRSLGYVSDRAWREAFFPERLFLTEAIGAGHGPEFDAAVGRTPFVDQLSFEEWFHLEREEKSRSVSARALRRCLIGLVADGALDAASAESFREVWGLEPMARKPSPERYDPRKEATWTLPMCVAWIAWRSYDRVREAMHGYRETTWEWFGYSARVAVNGGTEWFVVDGEELRTLQPLSLFGMGLLEALGRQRDTEVMQMSVKSAREDLWMGLAEGNLTAAGVNGGRHIVEIPAHEWTYIKLEADRKGMDRLTFRGGLTAYSDVTIRRSNVETHWPAIRQAEAVHFDVRCQTWTLYQAVLWVGCSGQHLSSQQIVDEGLDDAGASALFTALLARKLTATGFNSMRVREPIPSEYWELATVDPRRAREGHYVSFIDDILQEEDGGQLTPYGEEGPRWFGIRLERDALFAAFPEIAGSIAPQREALATAQASGGRKLAVAREAIAALHPHGVPRGLTDKQLLAAVNKWLRESGNSDISSRTLARAKAG